MIWISGRPFLSNHTLGKCFLLEFAQGDRFLVARHVFEDDQDRLLNLENGGNITDPIAHFLLIPDPTPEKDTPMTPEDVLDLVYRALRRGIGMSVPGINNVSFDGDHKSAEIIVTLDDGHQKSDWVIRCDPPLSHLPRTTKMLGTNWTAPNLGATVAEILLARQDTSFPPGLSMILGDIPAGQTIGLELTGEPLCNYDYRRIRQAVADYRQMRRIIRSKDVPPSECEEGWQLLQIHIPPTAEDEKNIKQALGRLQASLIQGQGSKMKIQGPTLDEKPFGLS